MTEPFDQLRLMEAILFASAEPLRPEELARYLPEDCEVESRLEELAALYANRGVNLVRLGKRWAFRTATDLAPFLTLEKTVSRKLSRAAVETLAIIAYHQPVTRAEVEEIRGVGLARGTLDTLLEAGWIRPMGRRRTPGRPVTWGTSEAFLDQFGLESLDSLPGRDELKAAGLLDSRPAIAVLGARGELMDLDGAEGAEPDDEEAEDDADALPDGFGEDLVPHEAEALVEPEDDGAANDEAVSDTAARADGGS